MAEKSRIFQRHQWLISLLQRSKRLTFQQISDAWDRSPLNARESELSLRTFHRHKTEIEEIFGIVIKCNKSDNTYYIDNEGEVAGGGVQDWMISTIAVDNMLNESRDLRDRIQFENIPGGREHLSTIIAAMREGRQLDMTYKSINDINESSTWLEPYFIKVFEQRWYVIGRTGTHENEKSPRVYALDRIISLEVSSRRFKYPEKFDPEEFFNYSYGIFRVDEKPQLIKLKADKRQSKFLDLLPIHRSQEKILEECTEEYSIYQYLITPAYDFIQYLCSQGAGLEVIEPKSLRDTVAAEIKRMYDNYFSN